MSLQVVDPETQDAWCVRCKAEVRVRTDLACPRCGDQIHPLSLARVPKKAEAAASADDGGGGQQVALPPIREAVAWSAATDALLDALEREELAALRAYEAARERVRAARRGANAMRRLRDLVAVEAQAPALPKPKKAAKPRTPRVVVETLPDADAAASDDQAPPTHGSATDPSERPWSRQFAACINCGTTGRKPGTTAHAAKGRCFLCYAYHARHGVERPVDRDGGAE